MLIGFALALLLALGFLVWQWLQGNAQRAAARTTLLSEVARATQARPVDGGELSRLVAQLQKVPDHESDRELVAALARIELARGRAERARALFLPIASQPGAAPAEQRLGAQILLRCQESGTADRTAAATMLQQIIGFAEAAYADGHDADDLLTGWLAANRLFDAEREKRFAGQLRSDHAGSPAAKLVQLEESFQLDMPLADVTSLRAEFTEPPAEIDAMHILLVLQKGDLPAAVALTEPALQHSPGVDIVRHVTAIVFHACVKGHAESPDERASWAARRDAQLDWLEAHAPPDDGRRPVWTAMRADR